MTKEMARWILEGGWINAEFSAAAVEEAKKVMGRIEPAAQGTNSSNPATAS